MNNIHSDITFPSRLFVNLDDTQIYSTLNLGSLASVNETKEMSNRRVNIILAARISVIIVSVLLLVCTCFNIYAYVIKKKRYRDVNDLLFYINAVLVIVSQGMMAGIFDLPNEDICSIQWLIINKIPEFLNLNLGICQASTLTQLNIKLR